MAKLDWLPEELLPVAMRVAHADDLAYAAGLEAYLWSKSSPVSLARERFADGAERLFVEAVRPVPPKVGLLFSDAVNHLRSALDNVVFHLAQAAHDDVLTEQQERAISFPIYVDQRGMDGWIKKMSRAGLPQLTGEGELGRRLMALQPFNDADRSVPTMNGWLSLMLDQPVHRAHPLVLLQAYSNTDKHRALRVAVHQGFQSVNSAWFAGQHSRSELAVGETLFETKPGERATADLHPFVGVERPGAGGTLVGIGPELSGLERYVAHHAVPVMVTGVALEHGLPTQLDLSDTGQTMGERVAAAGYVTAHDRLSEMIRQDSLAAEGRPYKQPPLRGGA